MDKHARSTRPHPLRRQLLRHSLALPLWSLTGVQAADGAPAALRAGGVVVVLRHALAPGTFDPSEFKLGDCRTQRNLNDEGRDQARRLGLWFQGQGLKPARVRSSPWCRCVDTAALAFGGAETWPALGSPRGYSEQSNDDHLRQMRAGLAAVAPRAFEVWVTHAFVQQALCGESTAAAEALVLRLDARGAVQKVARLAMA